MMSSRWLFAFLTLCSCSAFAAAPPATIDPTPSPGKAVAPTAAATSVVPHAGIPPSGRSIASEKTRVEVRQEVLAAAADGTLDGPGELLGYPYSDARWSLPRARTPRSSQILAPLEDR